MRLYRASPSDGWAWVTGASSGIGRAVALRLAASGYRVAVTARRADDLQDLAREAPGPGEIVPFPGDVSDSTQMAQIVEALAAERPISLALLNAGIYLPTGNGQWSAELFEKTFSVNVLGVSNAIVPLHGAMRAAGGGHIAIVSSVAGYGGLPTSAAYGASKAALFHLASALTYDFGPDNIRLQVLSPGFVDTPATEQNPFPMPFLMTVDQAADRVLQSLESNAFEVSFPRRFSWMLKAVNLLPYGAYHALVRRFTGWKRSSL